MYDEMSKEALELIKLVGEPSRFTGDTEGSLSATLKKHPKLLAGLDEYIKWRDQKSLAIAKTRQTAPVAHDMARIIKKLRKGKKKVRK